MMDELMIDGNCLILSS